MKILYIAKHDSGHNDDEGAISHALTKLGHEVVRVRESEAQDVMDGRLILQPTEWKECELCLIHKYGNETNLKLIRDRMPVVFWYFDRVGDDGDVTLRRRSKTRQRWMSSVRRIASLGLCTDGDWVTHAPRSNNWCELRKLNQGFDERLHMPVDHPFRRGREVHMRFLFPGTIKNCGHLRNAWFSSLQKTFGERFRHTVSSFGADLTTEVDESLL